ncbi:DUF2157 domain-containing protein [Chitinolyticbacter albus]|uniref:DUF2157 domain-containing protein n=1 Tax=Chitinolyticbacter albus TaxID=2961951 RepID=UPI00210EA75C|nr:DUF2157 domain-containing protein [Chitinolyticbacter albus]
MAPRDVLDTWWAGGALTDAGHRRAVDALALDDAGWRSCAQRLLLALGTISVLAGVLMIFASNWLTWPRLVQVGVAELAWLAALALTCFTPRGQAAHRWAAFAVAVLTGVVLAVIGQAYQTGADAWQLFALWAALLLPWLLYLRWLPLGALFILVGSLAIVSWQGVHRVFLFDTLFDSDLNLPLAAFWGLALAHIWPRAQTGGQRMLALTLASLITLLTSYPACLTWAGGHSGILLDQSHETASVLVLGLWAAWLALCTTMGVRRNDIVPVALVLFAAWAALLSLMARIGHFEDIAWLVAIVAVISLATIGWLLHQLQQRWQEAQA